MNIKPSLSAKSRHCSRLTRISVRYMSMLRPPFLYTSYERPHSTPSLRTRNFSENAAQPAPEIPAQFTQSYPHHPPISTPKSTSSQSTPPPRKSAHSPNSTISCTKSQLPDDEGTLARIQINNPEKLNTLSHSTLSELHQTFESLSTIHDLRIIILSGCPPTKIRKVPSFCGGANINEMFRLSSQAEAEEFITSIHNVCTSIRHNPAIVIAQIHGLCLGAGLEIAASCDFRFASSVSIFGMPEVKLGIPSVVEARLLANLIGWSRTRQMVYLAENYDAEMVHEMGLVDEVCENIEVLEARVEKCIRVMSNHGPKAMRVQKELIRKWEELPLEDGIKAGIGAFKEMWADGGTEPKEYMAEFIERSRKRKGG